MIGVVGDDGAGELANRLRQADRSVVVGGAQEVLDGRPAVVVAVGERALVDLVQAGVDTPVLPVGDLTGLPSVPTEGVRAATDNVLAGDHPALELQLLSVTIDDEPAGPALFDVMLVRAEPGRISEFGLAAGGTDARFRADGVVVATPTGSHGYAHAAGGPRLGQETAAVAVVPVAAFGLGAPAWVFDSKEEVQLSVERDEGDVSLFIDGRERRRLSGRTAVVMRAGGTVPVVRPPDR